MLYPYDVDAPLNQKKTLESTINGVEVSAIAFDSPDGGSVTGMLFDPVTRGRVSAAAIPILDRYSWTRCGAGVLEALEKAAANG